MSHDEIAQWASRRVGASRRQQLAPAGGELFAHHFLAPTAPEAMPQAARDAGGQLDLPYNALFADARLLRTH